MNQQLFAKWYNEIYKLGDFDDAYSVCLKFISWANNQDVKQFEFYKQGYADGALAALSISNQY